MLDPFTEIPSLTSRFVNAVFRNVFFPGEQGGLQGAAQFFVSVHRENPVVGGALGRVILLVRVGCPGALNKDGAACVSDFSGAIGTAGIHDYYLFNDSMERC